QAMVIFEGGDINSALHFLAKSMENPFACNSVATVLVENSLRDEFVGRVQHLMQPMRLDAWDMAKFNRTLDIIEKLNIEAIHCNCKFPEISPLLVFNCQHGQLAHGTSGVICVRTFSTIAEIVDIFLRESLLFAACSLWNESIEDLYQLVVALNCPAFFFNCSDVNLQPVKEFLAGKKNAVCVNDGFHYESLLIEGDMKTIVFPVGAHLFH
ncbi:hypothetical protein KR044_008717, partial [Drosophila immigrans]